MGNVNAATLVKEFLGASVEDKIRYNKDIQVSSIYC
jgi:hypothetical protein